MFVVWCGPASHGPFKTGQFRASFENTPAQFPCETQHFRGVERAAFKNGSVSGQFLKIVPAHFTHENTTLSWHGAGQFPTGPFKAGQFWVSFLKHVPAHSAHENTTFSWSGAGQLPTALLKTGQFRDSF